MLEQHPRNVKMKSEYHKRYLEETGKRTLRVGTIAAVCAMAIIPFFYSLDIRELQLEGTLGWRLTGFLGAALFFLAYAYQNRPRVIILLNAVTLTACLIMMHGITFKIFTAQEYISEQEFGTTVGTMSVWMGVTLLAAGSRWLLGITGLTVLIVNGLCYTMVAQPHTPGLVWSINMVALFVIITMYLQERQERKKSIFVYQLEEREERIAKQRESLKRINQNLVVYNFAISHELKTPLRSASTYTQLLAMELEKKGISLDSDYIKNITGSLKSGYQVIDDILLLSEIGEGAAQFTQVDLDDIVKDIWEEQSKLISKERHVNFRKSLLGTLVADEKLMQHLFRNLLSNAIKYTGKQKEALIELEIASDNGYKTICVKDNGIGFDNSYASEIGKPFKRFHAASDFKGTGVGLTIVKQIISIHRGSFWAKGKENEGACFYCKFPHSAKA